jgi:hypothetical protein
MNLQDVLNIEGEAQSESEYALSMQRAINSGSAWSFQGSMGRAMMNAIEAGVCMLGESRARDFWGNTIPARTDVQEGTKGSRKYVEDRMGDAWVEMLEDA